MTFTMQFFSYFSIIIISLGFSLKRIAVNHKVSSLQHSTTRFTKFIHNTWLNFYISSITGIYELLAVDCSVSSIETSLSSA